MLLLLIGLIISGSGQIVHVPFEDGVVYEGTYDPDNGTTTSVFTPWSVYEHDGRTMMLLLLHQR